MLLKDVMAEYNMLCIKLSYTLSYVYDSNIICYLMRLAYPGPVITLSITEISVE